MNELIRQKLCELIARQGQALCAAPDRCKKSLHTICRKHPAEKYVLISILEMGMVRQILELAEAEAWPGLQEQLVGRLTSERALKPSAARWGLDCWALALGKIRQDQLGPDVESQPLGGGPQARTTLIRLLASLLAGAVLGTCLWAFGMAVGWGLQGVFAGALVGAGTGLFRCIREGVASPLVIAGWAVGGFLAAVLYQGMNGEVVFPLTGIAGWVIGGTIARAILFTFWRGDDRRAVHAAMMGGVIGGAIGWPAAGLLTTYVTDGLELPWNWCLVGGITGVFQGLLEQGGLNLRRSLGQAFLKGLAGALLCLGAGYLSGEGGLLGWTLGGALLLAVPGLMTFPDERHGQTVWCVAFSPKGDFALSASADGTIGLWQLAERALVGLYREHGGPVYGVAFSHDGHYCVSGGADATVRVVDGTEGEQVFCFTDHADTVLGVGFSPGDDRVVSASADGTVRLWDLNQGEQTRCLSGHTGPVTCVTFSPDGAQVLSGGLDGTARLWDAETGQELYCFPATHGAVHAVTFTPDGKGIVIAADDGLRWCDAVSHELQQNFVGNSGPVHGVAVALDGRRLLSGGEDGNVRLWDMPSGVEIISLAGHHGPVRSVAFSPNGRSALSGGDDGTVRMTNLPVPL